MANIVVTRDRLNEEEELIDYAERHLDELEESMEGFFLLNSVEEEVASKTVYTMTFSSDGPDGPLTQRLTMVQLHERLVLAVTLTAPEREIEQLEPLFDRIVDSIEWGEGE